MENYPEPTSIEEANAVLEDIRASKGYLSESTFAEVRLMSQTGRYQIERVTEKAQSTAAKFTKSIAEQLYSSKTRFIYEMIQNADDARYSVAAQSKEPPSLCFDVSPQRIIVDTNEDGFTTANVQALCSTGESSKKASENDDHIGEKGFGFKSVFALASKVHVQSGFWSFRFEHEPGQSGLGMVTPLPEEPSNLPAATRTRIILDLHDEGRASYTKIAGAFELLPDTTIIFLQRISKISISIGKVDESFTTSTLTRCRNGELLTLEKTSRKGGGGRNEMHEDFQLHYRDISKIIFDMPRNENRKYERDGQECFTRTAPVTLAFPVDPSGKVPQINNHGEHVFAFLPLRRVMRLRVLIHSDFVTAASREDITDCSWNDRIMDGIAEIFGSAITRFCATAGLAHRWLDYVPVVDLDGSFGCLHDKVIHVLKQLSVFKTWQSGSFKRASTLRIVPPEYVYEQEPLLRDLTDETYLGSGYMSKHHSLLKEIGVEDLKWQEVISRLQHDLGRGDSKVRTLPAANNWHVVLSQFLIAKVHCCSADTQLALERCAILPLQSGGWETANSMLSGRLLYLPFNDSIRIPSDLGYNLLDPAAASVGPRKDLFVKLHVRTCHTPTVVEKIVAHHGSSGWTWLHQNLVDHLRYLYVFDESQRNLGRKMWVVTASNVVRHGANEVYFKSDHPLDTTRLLAECPETQDQSHNAEYLHDCYLAEEISDRPYHNQTWRKWLSQVVGVRHYPALLHADSSNRLSSVLSYIIQSSPPTFLKCLRAHWDTEYRQAMRLSSAHLVLGRADVPCKGGKQELSKAYLPTDVVRTKAEQLEVVNELPVIRLDPGCGSENWRDWVFLNEISVKSQLDPDFYLAALRSLSTSTPGPNVVATASLLYKDLANLARQEESPRLRQAFSEENLICLPPDAVVDSITWESLDDCLWLAPDYFQLKYPLEPHYKEESVVVNLFSVFLGLGNATFRDILEELAELRKQGMTFQDTTVIQRIYRDLGEFATSNHDWQAIRLRFESEKLVYFGGHWYAASDCLWTSAAPITGKVVIGESFPGLKTFFTTKLKVKTADTSMLVRELIKKAKRPILADVKDLMVKISTMLRLEPVDDVLKQQLDLLKNTKFLPVKMPRSGIEFRDCVDDFIVVDHYQYGQAFQDLVPVLNFALEEIHQLQQLLLELKLDARYLSRRVRTETSVGTDSLLDSKMSDVLRERAFAFYCCAFKFQSSKALGHDSAPYQQLLGAKVYRSESISSNVTITYRGGEVTVPVSSLQVLVKTEDDELKIYLPNQTQQYAASVRSKLPEELLTILGVTDFKALYHINLHLTQPVEQVEEIMRELSIANIPWLTKLPVSYITTASAPRYESLPSFGTDQAAERGRPTTPQSSSTSTATPRQLTPSTPATGQVYQTGQSRMTPPPIFSPYSAAPPRLASQVSLYRRLLQNVVRQARGETDQTGSGSSLGMSDMLGALPSIPLEEVFEATGLERDFRIGAAGELFVFETLKTWQINGIGLNCWQSRIRNRVSCHPDYSNLTAWTHMETADIVYEDTTHSLYDLLSSTDVLHPTPLWRMEGVLDFDFDNVRYFIEVKTTVSTLDTERFHMSSGEYDLMYKHRLEASRNSSTNDRPTVYLIFRVLNLLSPSNIRLKIYADPWASMQAGDLSFVSKGWEVYPKEPR